MTSQTLVIISTREEIEEAISRLASLLDDEALINTFIFNDNPEHMIQVFKAEAQEISA